jgi:hypothetical protein
MPLLFSGYPSDADIDLLSSLAELLPFYGLHSLQLWEYPFFFCLDV